MRWLFDGNGFTRAIIWISSAIWIVIGLALVLGIGVELLR